MKSISVFNNKGGVGKTTLTFHLAHALALKGKRTLILDLDPQCNISILSLSQDELHDIWVAEDEFIDDYQAARDRCSEKQFKKLYETPRSVHFILKPTEDGAAEPPQAPPPIELASNLHLIPGRLSMHMYEDKIASRWSDVYLGQPLALRTINRFHELARSYSAAYGYDFVILDTSPNLGAMNKVVISTTDGFLIPCMPDMFSLYGIRNIGSALGRWKQEFDTLRRLLSEEKKKQLPDEFVRLLGYTIYNAKKYTGKNKPWNLATAHYNYATQIPVAIKKFIPDSVRHHLQDLVLAKPIGETAVMHSHNTLPMMAQKYQVPIWQVPDQPLATEDLNTVQGNRLIYESTKDRYTEFADELLHRVSLL
jgi:cellulose biosynthesis protein BcsQ